MDYQICFDSFRKNFALPDLLSIQQLKQVDGRYLKVLLLLFQNPDRYYTSDLLSSLLELPESVVEDALNYWAQHGAVTLKDRPAPPAPAPVLSGGEVRTRVPADDEELRFLLSSMEGILNRPVNSTDIQEVIQIYESYRLPADVIIMAMQFCAGQGHSDIRYIKRCATTGISGESMTTTKQMSTSSSWPSECPWRGRSKPCLVQTSGSSSPMSRNAWTVGWTWAMIWMYFAWPMNAP